jgi:peptide/nickel transport system permease protein/oligopeptide transport system permease protein
MLAYLIKRIAASAGVMLAMILLVMLIMDIIPGDPAALMLGESATPEMVANLRSQMGLDQPIYVRYVQYTGRLFQGDLGRSVREMSSVSALLAATWPNTLLLAGAAMVLSLLIGLPLGVISAARSGSWLDHASRIASLLGLCLPVFWIGLVMMFIFSLTLGWFPTGGSGGPKHLILPAVTLALHSVASLARMTRSSLLEVLGEDYVRTARAKGLGRWSVVLRHGLRNALIPIVTVFGMQVGQLMGGAILTETVFAWPGVGRLMVGAILGRDYMLLQGTMLLFAGAYVLINLLVDLSYGLIDPRVSRAGGER